MGDKTRAIIRPYQPRDYPSVKDNLEEGNLFYEPMDSQERLRAKVTQNPGSILVATVDGVLAGSIMIIDDWGPLLFRLAVRKKFRGQGIGRQLTEAAIERVKSKGFTQVHLLVDDDKPELQTLYRHWGFKKGPLYRWMYRTIGRNNANRYTGET